MSPAFRLKMTSIAGSPAASTASPPPRPRRCNTQVRLITPRDSPICIPTAPFPPAGHPDSVGDRLAWASAGPHSRMDNGSWIPHLAGPGSATSHGAGLPITMEGGSSTPPVAAGFIPRRFSTGTPRYPVGRRTRFPRGVHPPQPIYRPVTAVFVRQGVKSGIVPMHPLDQKGKTPLNIERGVFSNVGTKGVSAQVMPVERGQKWETLKSPPRAGLSGSLVASGPPTRVSRTVVESNSVARAITLGKDSSIAYDPREHRFVNTNSSAASSTAKGSEIRVENGRTSAATSTPPAVTPARTPAAPPATRSASSPPARNTVPPPAPRYSGGERGASGGRGGSTWSGGASSSGSSAGRSSSSTSSAPSAPSAHPSSGRPH